MGEPAARVAPGTMVLEKPMRALALSVLLALSLAIPAFAHGPEVPPPPDTRPQHVKAWIAAEATRLTLHPQGYQLVWPRAWIAVNQDGALPVEERDVQRAMLDAAREAERLLTFDILRIENELDTAQRLCAERMAANPSAGPSCLAPCQGSCPAKLTPAEQWAMRQGARLEASRARLIIVTALSLDVATRLGGDD